MAMLPFRKEPVMNPFEDTDRNERKEHVAVDVPPAWALSYARGALNCGRGAPEIQIALASKGLSEGLAAAAVDRCFEARIATELQRQKRATRRKWISRTAALVVAAGTLAIMDPKAMRESGIQRMIGLLLPALGCIWFAETLGRYTGPIGVQCNVRTTPAIFVALGGWILLLAIAMIALLFWR